MIEMNSIMVQNVVMYYSAAEKLDQLHTEEKITREHAQRAKGYIARKYGLQNELLDSFLG